MYKQIYDFLNACESNKDIKNISFALVDKEKVLFEFSKPPYKIDQKRIMFSLTKSFTSIAIGILYDRGLLKLDDKVFNYLNSYFPINPSKNLLEMTIKDLLTMGSGVKEEDFRDALTDIDFIETFFKREFTYKPGTHFLYSTRTSHMLSAIIYKITGMRLHEFLEINLFDVIGVKDYYWEITPEGNSYGGSGLQVSHDVLTKIAHLLLNNGIYDGKQIVSKDYLDMATSTQIIKQDSVGTIASKSRGIGYGYQFHIVNENEYAADGAFGQIIYVFKDKGIAVVLTSQTTDFVEIYRLIHVYFGENKFSNEMSKNELENYVNSLSYITEEKEVIFSGDYAFDLNENTLKLKNININKKNLILTLLDGHVDVIDFKQKEGFFKTIKTINFASQKYYLNIIESTLSKLEIELLHLESPFVTRFIFEIDANNLIFNYIPKYTFYMQPYQQVIKK